MSPANLLFLGCPSLPLLQKLSSYHPPLYTLAMISQGHVYRTTVVFVHTELSYFGGLVNDRCDRLSPRHRGFQANRYWENSMYSMVPANLFYCAAPLVF